MSIHVDLVNETTTINVQNAKMKFNNFVTIQLGELTIDLPEKDAKYLMEEIEMQVLDHKQQRHVMEERIDELEESLESTKDQLLDYKYAV